MGSLHRRALAPLALVVTLAGCSASNLISLVSLAPSPHERYADGLRGANLDDTALGRDWTQASARALQLGPPQLLRLRLGRCQLNHRPEIFWRRPHGCIVRPFGHYERPGGSRL